MHKYFTSSIFLLLVTCQVMADECATPNNLDYQSSLDQRVIAGVTDTKEMNHRIEELCSEPNATSWVEFPGKCHKGAVRKKSCLEWAEARYFAYIEKLKSNEYFSKQAEEDRREKARHQQLIAAQRKTVSYNISDECSIVVTSLDDIPFDHQWLGSIETSKALIKAIKHACASVASSSYDRFPGTCYTGSPRNIACEEWANRRYAKVVIALDAAEEKKAEEAKRAHEAREAIERKKREDFAKSFNDAPYAFNKTATQVFVWSPIKTPWRQSDRIDTQAAMAKLRSNLQQHNPDLLATHDKSGTVEAAGSHPAAKSDMESVFEIAFGNPLLAGASFQSNNGFLDISITSDIVNYEVHAHVSIPKEDVDAKKDLLLSMEPMVVFNRRNDTLSPIGIILVDKDSYLLEKLPVKDSDQLKLDYSAKTIARYNAAIKQAELKAAQAQRERERHEQEERERMRKTWPKGAVAMINQGTTVCTSLRSMLKASILLQYNNPYVQLPEDCLDTSRDMFLSDFNSTTGNIVQFKAIGITIRGYARLDDVVQ